MKESVIKDLIIRPMEDDDADAASELEAKVFSMPWSSSDFLEMIRATYAHYFVAELKRENSKIIGICGLRDIAGEGEITNVAVDEEYRRMGIGKLLMKSALERANELGINDITLEVRAGNQNAIALYESLGFEGEGIRPNFYEKPKEDALIMWRRNKC